jgi:BirA family biotin operon repressor/biotin-[acetyl-CoA-carboxylase] ligase
VIAVEPTPIDLDAARIADRAGGGWSVEVVAETGSTNADLVARCADDPCPGVALLAERQTAGRGRHGRVWTAPPGGTLTMSVVVDASGPDAGDALGWLPLVAGVAVARAVAEVGPVEVGLKWPNDVLLPVGPAGEVGKVAGILAELAPGPRPCAVVGIGINTGLRSEDLPVATATSLNLATGQAVDRSELAGAVLAALTAELADWPEGVAAIADRYRPLCATISRPVRVELPGDRTLEGVAVDVDAHGRVVVEAPDGTTTAVAAGDVTHLRVQG